MQKLSSLTIIMVTGLLVIDLAGCKDKPKPVMDTEAQVDLSERWEETEDELYELSKRTIKEAKKLLEVLEVHANEINGISDGQKKEIQEKLDELKKLKNSHNFKAVMRAVGEFGDVMSDVTQQVVLVEQQMDSKSEQAQSKFDKLLEQQEAGQARRAAITKACEQLDASGLPATKQLLVTFVSRGYPKGGTDFCNFDPEATLTVIDKKEGFVLFRYTTPTKKSKSRRKDNECKPRAKIIGDYKNYIDICVRNEYERRLEMAEKLHAKFYLLRLKQARKLFD